MNRFLLLLPLLLIIGCQTSLTLSHDSSEKEFARANAGCRAGDNKVRLRGEVMPILASRVQFTTDSVTWMLSDSTCSGAPLYAVSRVENCDYVRGAAEGTRMGFGAGLMAGGFLVSMAMGRADKTESTPWILLATTTLIMGPLTGHAEGADRGSQMTILVDSTAKKK
jgi:hypothetical protein